VNHSMIDHLTQGRSKVIMFDPNKSWEEIGAMMHIIPRHIGTVVPESVLKAQKYSVKASESG
jgi:hypothetical protein